MTTSSGRRRRLVRGIGVGAAALVVGALALGWVLPNVAGGMFLQVRPILTPVVSSTGPQVILPSGEGVRADAIAVVVEVHNSYPLPVVVGTDPEVYSAAVYLRGSSGTLVRVWRSGTGDPEIEEGSDSPVGGGSAGGAVSVRPGPSRHDVAVGGGAFSLTTADGRPIPAGIYYLRVWAYGIQSPLVPISVEA